MQRKENIDNQVKKALDSIKPAYSEDLWKGIEQQLPAKKKPFAMYWRGMAALLLLTAGTAGVYFTHFNEHNIAGNQETGQETVVVNKDISLTGKDVFASAENTEKAKEQNTVTSNPYKQSTENALAQNFSKGNNHIQHRNSASQKKSSALNRKSKTGTLSAENIVFISSDRNKNSIYITGEKYLERITLAVNEVNNENKTLPAGRYSNKTTAENPIKKRNISNSQSSKITTYAFWQNAAYTGEQGKLNFSFDDKISYLEGENYSACQNNFGAEYAIPKSRFAVGLYHQRFLKQFSLKTTTGLSASARLFNIGKGSLKAGAGITYLSSNLFKNNLNFSDQIDAKAGFINTTRERNFISIQNTLGADAGIWYSSPRFMAGVSAKNINQPHFGRIEEGERLRREWQLAAGYNIPAGNNINIMPWAEVKTTAVTSQASTMLLFSYKDIVTLGAGYMNISPISLRGDVMAQASVKIKNRLHIYGMYGQNMEMKKAGLKQNIIQTGLRYQVQ